MALHGIHIKKSHKGLMHKDVGKAPGAPITEGDIQKELSSKDPKKRARGQFAKSARHFKHGKAKRKGSVSDRLYGKHEG